MNSTMNSTKKHRNNYFEAVYLGKNSENTLKENRKLQKLLTVKALNSSVDSRPLSTSDLKKMSNKEMNRSKMSTIDFDSYIFPYECI
ncbi:MAG: hypothetical protein ACJ76F_03845 [Bacteroidia bacterium]